MSTHEEGWIDPSKDAAHVAAVLAQGGFKVAVADPAAVQRLHRQLEGAPLLLAGPASGEAAVPPPAASTPAAPADLVRRVKPVSIANVVPAVVTGGRPRFEMADPKTLLIDETYQRNLSEKSLQLIRKMVGGWDWARFTPPTVAETPAGRELLDGQHTAIAAASHPTLGLIPIMIVDRASLSGRALAFVGRNRDRLGMTAMQLHFAAVAGQDPHAVAINQVCAAAGVNVLRVTPGNGAYKPGDTIAVAEIGKLIGRRGPDGAREILAAIADARVGPINAGLIKAVDQLLHDEEYRDTLTVEAITEVLARKFGTLAAEASVFGATHRLPTWKALASVIYRAAPKRRRTAGAVQ